MVFSFELIKTFIYFFLYFLNNLKKEVDKMTLGLQELTLLVILGTLAAIVYSLRVLVIMERRIARIELHLEHLVEKVMREELKIEKKLSRRRRKR